jgi:hypothetical protein
MNLLALNGRPIAFLYQYHHNGRVDSLRQGFDPEFGAFRPGLILRRMSLEDSYRLGDCVCDMGVGSLEVKHHWQTMLATSYRFTHFPLSVPKAQLLRLNRWLRSRIFGESDVACQGA